MSTHKPVKISAEQRQNIKTLLTDLQNSVDHASSETSVTTFKADLKTAVSDRILTRSEFKVLVEDVVKIFESAGVTASEARIIFYDLQDIAEASRLPRTNDNLYGTENDDILWTGLSNDTLTGATTSDAGVSDIDWLCGGGGKDKFILGDASTVFYNDGKAGTAGWVDYAVVLDFNKNKDTIQLKGNADDYILDALPPSLGITGTGIYYTAKQTVPELIGVIVGVNVSDFGSGFTIA
jgi:hypothetical protein